MSPVVGVILMIVVTILLASVIAAMAISFDDRMTAPDWRAGEENPWAEDPLVGPEDPTAGAEDVRYRVYFELEEDPDGAPLNTLTISVDAGDDMFSGTTDSDLEQFDIIRTNGSVSSPEEVHQWQADETELDIVIPGEGPTLFDEGEVVEIVFGGVDNPAEPGTYDVTVSLNQANITEQRGDLEIVDSS